jgi:phage FluMu protein Com
MALSVGAEPDGRAGTLLRVGESFEVECPHCRKTFAAELLEGAAQRYRGFKCPHCRLFVPAERVDPVKKED